MLRYAIAAGAAAAMVAAGYHTMAPRSQLYGRTFIGWPTRAGVARAETTQLALTFDDGPNDPYTLRLLDVLARHNVCATFFLLGRFAALRPDIVRDIARAGHALGNHTYHHPNLIFRTRVQIITELRACDRAIADALGTGSGEDESVTRALAPLFRPPFGGRRPGVLRIARQLGYVPVMWSVAGRDWTRRSAAEIERAIYRQLRGGEVILLHDGAHPRFGADRSRTVAATDSLISRCKEEGYAFVTVPEMMEAARG